MKIVVKTLGVVVSLFAVMTVSAQTGAESGTRYGKGQDSATCVRHLSLYQSDFQIKNYDAAIVNWRKVWRDCPLALVNMTIQGAQMYQYYIDRELNQDRKSALIDTLMQVWDKGIILRPQAAANYRQYMLQDMLKYADTPENQSKILSMLEGIIAEQKEKTPALMFASYWRIIFEQYTSNFLTDEKFIDEYNKLNDLLTDAIRKTTDEKAGEELARARDMFDEFFSNSAAASCENLIKIYSEKYDDNKNDEEFLRKLTRMLTRKECTDAPLFEMASEQMYALNPSADAAYNMAMLFFRRDNYDKAVEYFEEAIKNATDPYEKARFNHFLGTIMMSRYNRFTDAKRYALEASKLRPDWGEPYILLANTYVAGPKCGEDDFERAYVFWVAVDKLQRAKTVDPEIAPKADQLIKTFSPHFPKKEEGFFRNITEGNSVTVPCWINETTRVRFNN